MRFAYRAVCCQIPSGMSTREIRSGHYASSMAPEPEQSVAVIDLGSNSFRMVVFEQRGDSWERVDERSAAVRIGEGLATSGRLGEAAMGRALSTLEGFTSLCSERGLGEHSIDAVATSAIRDAENGQEFLERVRLSTGLEVTGAQPRAGGPLRLPRRRQLDHTHRRLRARPRWRVLAAGEGGGPLGARVGLLATGRGAHDRALHGRRGTRQAQRTQSVASPCGAQARARALAGRAPAPV